MVAPSSSTAASSSGAAPDPSRRRAAVKMANWGRSATVAQRSLPDMIEIVESHVIFDNPKPMLRSRHGYFPGIVQLPSGDLLALVVIGEAFEAVNLRTHVLRSTDDGRTWREEGPLDDGAGDP